LLNVDIDYVTQHFLGSRFSYSTQALPVNVLYDSLIRPFGETEEKTSCVKWVFDASKAVQHVVVGKTERAGGQWVDNPVKASWDIGTLSYASMLSLPGYSFDQHFKETTGKDLPFYMRPSRRQVADYLAAYPERVGIVDALYNGIELTGGTRRSDGFHFTPDIRCKRLILASGIFDQLIPPRPLLSPLSVLSNKPMGQPALPILVIGSGFSAADVIISTPADQKIIHIFKWDPVKSPSPLRACHYQAYPEYAGVYRRMKLAALTSQSSRDPRPRTGRRRSSTFDLSRDWTSNYEGLPNTEVVDVRIAESHAVITFRNDAKEIFERQISQLVYVVGRRGRLDYLEPTLSQQLDITESDARLLSAHSLRRQASESTEITKDVFIIGSLTGDSLIRFGFGSCIYAAGKLMRYEAVDQDTDTETGSKAISAMKNRDLDCVPTMNGLEGHHTKSQTKGTNGALGGALLEFKQPNGDL
jgi:hypothetical protein